MPGMAKKTAGCIPLVHPFVEVLERVGHAKHISLFLDFDGTLVEVGPEPDAIQLEEGPHQILNQIARSERFLTTVISGRAVEDLYSRVGVEGLIYSGNHGLEIFGRSLCFVEPVAAAETRALQLLSEDLQGELRCFAGTRVEYKGYTTSIHYWQAAQADRPRIEEAVRGAITRSRSPFRTRSGRNVLEVVPRTDWDKGAAVRWINEHAAARDSLSIYLGDDVTDEDGFRALPQGITVKVGRAAGTCARYQLQDPAAVGEFLTWLAGPEVGLDAAAGED